MTIPAVFANYSMAARPAQDGQGWTIIPAGPDAGGLPGTAVYVSDAGNDANPGTSASPIRTFEKAAVLLGNLAPGNHRLYVYSGTSGQQKVYTDHFNHADNPASPASGRIWPTGLIITSYGAGKRPLILTPNTQQPISAKGDANVGNIWIIGLWFMPQGYYDYINDPEMLLNMNTSPPFWLDIFGRRDGVHVENCRVQGYHSIFNIRADYPDHRPTRITIRRNVFYNTFDANYASGASGGGYVQQSDDVLIEENYFLALGHWDALGYQGKTLWQNLYIVHNSDRVIVQNNVIVDTPHSPFQGRGRRQSAYDNTIIRCGMGPSLGHALNTTNFATDAAQGKLLHNVIMGARDTNATNPRGQGINVSFCIGAEAAYNLIVNNNGGSVGNMGAISSQDDSQGTGAPPSQARVLTYSAHIHHNRVHSWRGGGAAAGVTLEYNQGTGSPYQLSPNFVIEDNVFSDLVTSVVLTRTDQGATIRRNALARNSVVFKLTNGTVVDLNDANAALGATGADINSESGPFDSATFDNTTIDTYLTAVLGQPGGSDYADFIELCLAQEKGNWNTALTSFEINPWARARFSMANPNPESSSGAPIGESTPVDNGGRQRRFTLTVSVQLD